ncbi:MAG TPA: RNA-binding cell elongation regulator Jag/EloR [Acidimicrobiales bacterium]|nr:RNA-binding cell elongation regulator Jag/EloR [Acidimicrobiales bacterium]
MEWVETTGRTVDEAKEAALDQLGVDESDAEFLVLTEPRPGLFGRLRGEARVRARVRPTRPRPKRGRSRRTGQDQRRSGGRQGGTGGESRSAVAVAESSLAEPASQARLDQASGNGSQATSQPSAAGTSATRRNRRRRSSSGRGGVPRATGGRTGDTKSSNVAHEEEDLASMSLSLEEQAESARDFVAGLLRELGLEAEVNVRTLDDSTAEVSVQGDGLGVLVGPGGATLAALQEVTRTVVQKHTGGHSERILVDVAGYRAKRAEALQRFTRQVAAEVSASGTEQALEPMSAADRKVVHDTVNEMAGVQTRSEGEDPRRFIVISPAAEPQPEDSDGA